MIENLKNIALQFALEGNEITYLEPYGEGHINSTYRVMCDNKYDYILQKINNHVFANVEGLMNNISLVTSFLKEQIKKEGGDQNRETMTIVKTKDNKNYYFDKESDSYYRVYTFVKDSLTLQKCTNKEDFMKSALGFSRFAKQLEGFDATKLIEPIANFHNTEKRFEHFLKVLAEDKLNRAKDCQDEINFVLAHKNDCSIVLNKIKEGKIPLRVTHNDTKLNNILFDKNTMEPMCVIDLDTIMPGSALYDFGDSIRFGCNPAGEDERDLSKVIFQKDYFEAFTKGYLTYLGSSLSKDELDYLAFGGKLMTLECGIRFLDDYLDGDKYFRIHTPDHNLVRCRTQFHLVKQMEESMDELNQIVHKLANR